MLLVLFPIYIIFDKPFCFGINVKRVGTEIDLGIFNLESLQMLDTALIFKPGKLSKVYELFTLVSDGVVRARLL